MAVGPGAPSIHPDRELTPVVLVTGGSRGIGLALARTFAGRGYDLMLVARGLERLQRVAEKIAAEFGVSVEAIACDLARAQGATELVEAVGAKGRYIDILVNCAGVGTAGPFERNTPAQVHTALHLNIDAATALMRACLPDMVARRLRRHQVLPRLLEPSRGARGGGNGGDGLGALARPCRHGLLRA
jgi:short-subunit dehydrogenase